MTISTSWKTLIQVHVFTYWVLFNLPKEMKGSLFLWWWNNELRICHTVWGLILIAFWYNLGGGVSWRHTEKVKVLLPLLDSFQGVEKILPWVIIELLGKQISHKQKKFSQTKFASSPSYTSKRNTCLVHSPRPSNNSRYWL